MLLADPRATFDRLRSGHLVLLCRRSQDVKHLKPLAYEGHRFISGPADALALFCEETPVLRSRRDPEFCV
jgi:hypothetical protein